MGLCGWDQNRIFMNLGGESSSDGMMESGNQRVGGCGGDGWGKEQKGLGS